MRKPVVALLLIAILLLTSCGPAMKPSAGPATENGEVFMLALPRIIVDFDSQGAPSILDTKLTDVGKALGQELPNYQLDPRYVAWMQASNVQHIEMRQTGNGLALIVNGQQMPYIQWDDASLQRLAQLSGLLNFNVEPIQKFMPVVRRLGLDLVLRFPRATSAMEIPLSDPEAALKPTATPSGRAPSAVLMFEVKYDANGVPAVLGLRPSDLNLQQFGLVPQVIQQLQRNNIQNLELRSKEDGLTMYVNGQPLPGIAWDDTMLANATDLYSRMNDNNNAQVRLIKGLLPLINKADVGVLLHFPVAAGQQVIPAKMH